ncbi:dTDP-4-dehydrorhamnose reductase [Brachymonas sp. J145]|uniref:dTDP-4-dehydrorhamnose reductase n=1 Tax=Brachymonas sp. J145 TaxID=3116489 RepID=UPI002E78F715|nr:dTDP-4-dehydrorhamnose reductase [Brachymonas sp. J145]MEE1653417.1 dTDP-4-dehydrorhamnose reductase [Brachymonas sp. J145]
MTKRILLLGKNGQVGWELQRSLAPLGELWALGRDAASNPHWQGQPLHGDLADPDALARTVQLLQPDVIVNAAAYTAVDKAESEPELAHTINATAVGVLAQQAQALDALLVHYSTDYVFDGSGQQPWPVDASTGPLNVYGHSKLAGEQQIRASGAAHLIFRTSWVYAARGGNFAKTMLRLAQERDALSVINDQWGAPTGAELIADVTAHAVRQYLAGDTACTGTYHLAASGETSWHGYAQHVLAQAQGQGVALRVASEAVAAIPSSAYPVPAQRPANSRLDTTRLQQALGLTLPPWQQGVDRMLQEILA